MISLIVKVMLTMTEGLTVMLIKAKAGVFSWTINVCLSNLMYLIWMLSLLV